MRIILIIISITFLASCTHYQKIVYLQSDADKQKTASMDSYILRTGDLLYIKVYSQDVKVSNMFNLDLDQAGRNYNEIGMYLSGFQVDDSLCIELPVVGKIVLANKTFSEAKKLISDSVNSYINDAIVKVKLLSYRITILGEVVKPGILSIYHQNSTIFDVLSKCGDIKMLGDRQNIEVLRSINGEIVRLHLDLTRLDALNNPAYYIYPNDVVYVKPLRSKVFRDNIPVLSLSLSIITTFLLLMNYIK